MRTGTDNEHCTKMIYPYTITEIRNQHAPTVQRAEKQEQRDGSRGLNFDPLIDEPSNRQTDGYEDKRIRDKDRLQFTFVFRSFPGTNCILCAITRFQV